MEDESELQSGEKRFLKTVVPVSAFVGGLCCFTPVVVVLFGLGSVSYAASLTDLLYYEYRWVFQASGLGLLLGGLGVFLYASGEVCSIDEAVRKRRKIINMVVISVSFATMAYILWLYVVVELIGIALGIW